MGILAAALSAVFAVVALIAGKISKVEKHRISFALLGMLMTSVWVISLGFVTNALQLLAVGVFNGVAGAFTMLLFAIYGDFFKRKQHAMLVVLWEFFLMIGRLGNLVPTNIFLGSMNYKEYFFVIGIISLCAIPIFLILKRMHHAGNIKVDALQV